VRDAPRHIGPCRLALRGNEIRHVVERHDIAPNFAALHFRRQAHQQRAQSLARTANFDVPVFQARAARHDFQQRLNLWRDDVQRMARQGFGVGNLEKLGRRRVHQIYMELRIEPYNARRHAGQDGFGKTSP